MRSFRNVVLPAFMLMMVVAMPLADSVFADLPPPQATPVSDDPILIEGELIPPTFNEVCGPDNDEIIPAASQPEGVNPQPEISAWENSQATLTYAPLDGYAFPDGMSNVIIVDEIDADPCEDTDRSTMSSSMQPTQQTEPIITFNVPENLYGLPDAGVNATVEYDFGDYEFEGDDDELVLKFRLYFGAAWTTTTYEMEAMGRSNVLQLNTQVPEWLAESCLYGRGDFSGRYELFIHNPTTDEVEFKQSTEFEVVPCSAKVTPEPPSVSTSICGLDSEIEITVPEQQEHVTITDSGWVNGTRTITYTPADYVFFPYGTQTEYAYTTDSCITSLEIEYDEDAFLNRQDGVPVNIDVTFTLADAHPYDTVSIFHTQDAVVYAFATPVEFPVERGVGGSTTVTLSLPTIWGWGDEWYVPNHCETSDPNISIYANITGYTDGVEDSSSRLEYGSETFPCTWLYETEPDITINQLKICGPNNDTFAITVEPDIATFTIDEWQDGTTTIDTDPGFGEAYAWYYEYKAMEFTDTGDPCLESISLDAEDGAFIDAIPMYEVPLTATLTLADTHEYDSVQFTLYQNRASNPAGVNQIDVDVLPGDSGPATVNIAYPVMPEGTEALACVDGQIELEIAAIPYHPETGDLVHDAEISQTVSFPCSYLIQANPVIDIVQVEVCGPNNDTFEIASQPTGVGYIIHYWADGETSIEFFPEDGYYFWVVGSGYVSFKDESAPCPTDAPVPPLQAQVCGPDNDTLTIPPQPEGVEMEDDSGWLNGKRTVTFVINPAFESDGETEFIFTDENIACPIPTTTLTVQLIPSDGASLEGAPWQLFAPVAAQDVSTDPYAEGTVGTDNAIVVEELIAGDYRLVVNANGYESIDTVLTVADGETSQLIELPVNALQPVETPTPEPTIEPTVEPTIEATPPPAPTESTPATLATPAPTQQSGDPVPDPAPVTGLPSTGSGTDAGTGMLIGGLLAALVLGAINIVNRRHNA